MKKLETVKVFGTWSIDEIGNMNSKDFEITADRLTESDWWFFLLSEPNFSFNDFIPAYFHACKLAGVKEVKLIMQPQ